MGQKHQPADQLLGGRKGQALAAYQLVCQLGHGGKAFAGHIQSALPIHLQSAYNPLQEIGAVHNSLRDFIVQADHKAGLPPIAWRIGFHGVEHRTQGAIAPFPGIAKCFQGHGVAFLGHDGAVGAVLQIQARDAHLSHVPQQQALRHSAHILDKNTHGAGRLIGEIQAGRGVHRVQKQAVKAQQLGNPLPVDGKTSRGDGRAPHRAQVGVVVGCQQALQIAGKVFERTQIEVPKCNRLRMLGVVCIARYNGIFVLLCLSEQGIHQEGNRFTHIQQCLSGIHAFNGQVHIIAGTAGVELSAYFYPQFLNQPFLQIGEEIR